RSRRSSLFPYTTLFRSCMVLAAAVYIALSLIFKPVKRIGRIEVDALSNGEFLNDRLTEAGSDYNRMQRAVRQIQEQPLLRECQEDRKSTRLNSSHVSIS